MARRRVDELLVERGLAPGLAEARALVMAGTVIAGERRVDKAGERLRPDEVLRLRPRRGHAFVSRGGLKLDGALAAFGVDPSGAVCLDLGASTGGFTDCLLQHGARRVYAVDVGYGLLDWRLREDARVVVLERVHAAELTRVQVPEPIDLLVADISFNSLSRLLAPVRPLLAESATTVLLVKPQFELAAEQVGEGGVVRDPALWAQACAQVEAAVREAGLHPVGLERSSIKGSRGNVEFLLCARTAPA
ncbi:MAG: TlyA family RNA methyltransferase [Myxococcales bacterium]|nr:TlyA family RNA methyltransferase [Myxococcales bacterium]